MTFAGLLAPAQAWGDLWYHWAEILKDPEYSGVDFHASDCDSQRGDFRDWSPEKAEGLQGKLITLMTNPEYALVGYAVSFPIPELRKHEEVLKSFMFAEGGAINGPLDHPWFIGLLNLIAIVDRDPESPIPDGESVGFIFDQHHMSERGRVIHAVLADQSEKEGRRLTLGGASFRDRREVKPLQAADLFAYEVYRYQLDTDENGVRISAHVDHLFRRMSIIHFGACRSPVSVHVDQAFRSMSIT